MNYHKPLVAAGYCRKHNWKLSWRQIRIKECLDPGKQCHIDEEGKPCCSHLIKYNEHPAWDHRRKVAEERRKRKDERKLVKNEN